MHLYEVSISFHIGWKTKPYLVTDIYAESKNEAISEAMADVADMICRNNPEYNRTGVLRALTVDYVCLSQYLLVHVDRLAIS